MSFRKGLFAPTLKGEGSFAELQAQAFKGSDFGGGSEEEPMPGKIKPPVYQFAQSGAPKFVHRIKNSTVGNNIVVFYCYLCHVK